MLGAIYGDKAGSIYEYKQLTRIESINPEKLITSKSFYSDDTILTIAVIDAIINSKDYANTLKEYVFNNLDYKPDFKPYFKSPFSMGTIKWAKNLGSGSSIGNGALMRISPVGYLFDNESDVIKNARLVTITSHNTEEAITGSTIVALIIFYLRKIYLKC